MRALYMQKVTCLPCTKSIAFSFKLLLYIVYKMIIFFKYSIKIFTMQKLLVTYILNAENSIKHLLKLCSFY